MKIMGIEEGYIKSYRSIMDKSWYKKSEYFHLWHHLLYHATHKEIEIFFNGNTIKLKPGQLITGRKSLAKDTGINESKVERCLNYFEKIEHQIEQQKTNKNRLITIVNWGHWQISEQQNEQQLNNKRTTTEQLLNTNKNDKNVLKNDNNEKKKEKKEPNKSADFIDEIVNCFVKEYGDYEILNKGKERAAAGKLARLYRKKYPDANKQEALKGLRMYFKSCINIQDRWLRDNMSLPIIISKFNEINKILKNGKSKNGATVSQIANAIVKNFATDYEDTGEEHGED